MMRLVAVLVVVVQSMGGEDVVKYTPVGITAPAGDGDVEMQVLVPKEGEHAIADPATLFEHVQGAWDAVVEHHQEGLVDPKQAHLASSALTSEEAWHHYKAGRDGVLDSARFLITFGMIPSIQSGGHPLYLAAAMGDLGLVKKLLTDGNDVDEEKVTDQTTALHAAATMCQAKVIAELLSHGADPNRAARSGATPLMMAASIGCVEGTKELLKAEDIDKDQQHPFAGTTAMHFAAEMGRVEVLKSLCDAKADPNIKKKTGGNTLHTAADTNHSEAVAVLINYCNVKTDVLLMGDTTPLYLAAQRGFNGVVQTLIDNGANVNFVMPRGKFKMELQTSGDTGGYYGEKNTEIGNGATVLHAAAENGHLGVVDILLKNGAVQSTSMEGASPLLIAIQYRHPKIALRLLEDKEGCRVNDQTPQDGVFPLFAAIGFRYYDVIAKILAVGGDLSLVTKQGLNALSHALHIGDHELTTFLIRAGADPNLVLRDSYTMLQAAIKGGNQHCISLILKLTKGDIDAQPGDTTALHTACMEGNIKLAEALIKKGADINGKVKSSKATPLMLAAKDGRASLVKMLLGRGASVDAKGGRSMYWATPLYLAAQSGHLAVVEVLLEHGAQPDAALHKIHVTPLFVACERSHTGVAIRLLEAGANPNKVNSEGVSPLHVTRTLELAEKLVSAGATTNTRDKEGNIPLLTILSSTAPPQLVKYAIDISDVKHTRADGYGAVHALVSANPPRQDRVQVVKYLVSKGVVLGGTKNAPGWTPAMMAAGKGDADLLKALVQLGDILTNKDTTALHIAVKAKNVKICSELMKLGFDINTPDGEGVRVDYQVRSMLGLVREDTENTAFAKININGDKVVNRNELLKALERDTELQRLLGLPARTTETTKESFEEVFRSFDKNGDRGISEREFVEGIQRVEEERNVHSDEL